MIPARWLLLALALSAGLAACGKKGPLYLPEPAVQASEESATPPDRNPRRQE